jgi:predicted aconitase
LRELGQISNLIGNRNAKRETEFWVCTSQCIKEKAGRYVKKIEQNGGHVITDTCAVVTWTDKLGIKTLMTNSAKTAHYAPTMNNAQVRFATLKECIETAFEG